MTTAFRVEELVQIANNLPRQYPNSPGERIAAMNGVIEELRAYPRTDLTPGQVAMIRDTITAVQIQIASIREEAERAVLALFPPAATTSTRAATSAQQAVTPASDLCARILEVFKQALQILMNCISYLFAAVTSAPPPQTGAASQEVSSDCIRV